MRHKGGNYDAVRLMQGMESREQEKEADEMADK